jgi:hypothetical protein
MSEMFPFTAIIPDGAALSSVVSTPGRELVALVIPAGWATADITLKGSVDGDIFYDVHNVAGDEVVIKGAASRYVTVPEFLYGDFIALQFRSGTSALPVSQTGGLALTILME